jgi:hypothetical protein
MAKKNKDAKVQAPEYPKTIETYYPVGSWEIRNWTSAEPSAMNGWVRFKKYKITIEEIEEPLEVLQERLEKIWVENDNSHNWGPLQAAAASIGYGFKGERGSKRKKH